MKNIELIAVGLAIGVMLTGGLAWILMPGMMLKVHKSELDFDGTVSAIEQAISDSGTWKMPAVHDIQESLIKAGHTGMTKATIIELCQPHYAHDILKDDADKKAQL